MHIANNLLVLSFAFTLLKFITCYSNGLELLSECQTMHINHDGIDGTFIQPQNADPPYKIVPDNVTLSDVGTSINVVLSAPSIFRGFMLDARACDSCVSSGTFTLTDPSNSVLICNDHVVVQPNNVEKTNINVMWKPMETGQFFFRAAFLQDYETFWERRKIPSPKTTAPPTISTKPSLTTSLTIMATNATDNSITSPNSTVTNTETSPTTQTTVFTTLNTTIQPQLTDNSTTTPNSTVANTETSPNTETTNTTIQPQLTDESTTSPIFASPNSTVAGTETTAYNTTIHSQATVTETRPNTGTTAFTTSFNTTIHPQATDKSTSSPISASLNSTVSSTEIRPNTDTTVFTTASSSDKFIPTRLPQCEQYMRCILALLLFSRLCFLGGSSLLMIMRPVSKLPTSIASVIELAAKLVAAILVLIKVNHYECVCENAGLDIVFTVLTVVAMVSSLLHTITVLLHCGPSHELRKCWLGTVLTADLLNTTITSIAIFCGLWYFQDTWLPALLGVFVVLEFMLYLGSVCFKLIETYVTRKRNRDAVLEILPWLAMFVIFSVFNVLITIALILGVSLQRMINC